MSFMNSGAECSTSRNPLAQFTKHSSEDRTLQHERLAGPPGLHGAASSMRTNPQEMSAQDIQAMEMFNSAEAQKQNLQMAAANHSFHFDQMSHEISSIHHHQNRHSPALMQQPPQQHRQAENNWASDFALKQHPSTTSLESMNKGPAFQNPITGNARPSWAGEYSGSATPMAAGGMPFSGRYASGLGYMPSVAPISMMNARQAGPLAANAAATTAGTSTADSQKIIELNDKNWEEEFKKMESSSIQHDPATVTETETTTQNQSDADVADFESVWENIRDQVLTNEQEDVHKSIWDRDFDMFAKNRIEFGEYSFESENRYINDPDPFQIGVQLMESGGNISEAALAFEAAVQQKPDHSEAWGRLGACQAQNEKEDPAIRALERCITIDPNNLTALMNLAVSYINESYENAAYSTLEKWISTKYPEIVDKARTQEPRLGNEDRYHLHSRVTELFLRAAQLSPTGANMDADVQDGLGVLFYGSEDYEKAVDCFTSAITARPNDALLWNRLGATLANSDRSEEAIEAYSRALQLRPSFVRARYNLGVLCINIDCYHEAAQHLLAALSMDHTPEDNIHANQSTNLYSTLKRVFSAMNRKDLEIKVGASMDLESFRSEFDF